MPVIEGRTDIESVAFIRGEAPQVFRLQLWQERTAGGRALRTNISVKVRDSAAQRSDDVYTFERSYGEASIAIESDGAPMAPSIVSDVEGLLGTVRTQVRAKATGEIVEVTLLSAEAAQLEPILEIIEQSLAAASLRVPRESVRQGETWTWSTPFEAQSDEPSASATGKTEFTAEVVGEAPGGIVLKMELNMATEITIDGTQPLRAALQGAGTGVLMWDGQQGRIAASDVQWTASSRAGDEEVQTVTRVRLRSE